MGTLERESLALSEEAQLASALESFKQTKPCKMNAADLQAAADRANEGLVQSDYGSTDEYGLLRDRSKVYSRALESSQRVKRVNWGHPLMNVVRTEQYTRVEVDRKRRGGHININAVLIDGNDARKSSGKSEKVYFGAKIALKNRGTKRYFGVTPERDQCIQLQNAMHLTLLNLEDISSTAPVRFGDRVGLALSTRVVVGTKFLLAKRSLRVCPVANDKGALFTARWKAIGSSRIENINADGEPALLHNMDSTALEFDGHLLSCSLRDDSINLSKLPSNNGPASPQNTLEATNVAAAENRSPSATSPGSPSLSGASLNPGDSSNTSGTFDPSTLWQIVMINNNKGHSKMPAGQRILLKAQRQIQDMRDQDKARRIFAKNVRHEMLQYSTKKDVEYLVADRTLCRNEHEAKGLHKYLTDRLTTIFPKDEQTLREERRAAQRRAREEQRRAFQHSVLEKTSGILGSATRANREAKALQAIDHYNQSLYRHKDSVDQARVRALSNRIEMQVPTLVWDHVIRQDRILQEQEREQIEKAAIAVQRAFRNWKKECWARDFRVFDEQCTAIVEKEIAQSKKQLVATKRKKNDTTKATRADVKRSLRGVKVWNRHLAKSTSCPAISVIESKDRCEAPDTIIVSAKIPNDKQSDSSDSSEQVRVKQEQDQEAQKRVIEKHYLFLRRANPALFSEIPEAALRPKLEISALSKVTNIRQTRSSAKANQISARTSKSNSGKQYYYVDNKVDHRRPKSAADGEIASNGSKRASTPKKRGRRRPKSAEAIF